MTYQPKTYRKDGGDEIVIASGGKQTVESGGEVDIESGGAFKLAGTAIAATAAELNSLDVSANAALMSPGTGLSGATDFVYKVGIERSGNIITTKIYMDITGLNSGGAAGDIIGKDGGTANCHFGQVTAANNGTIYAGWIDVGEDPATGNSDIDLYSGDEDTGAENAPVSGLTNDTQLCDSGALSAGTRVMLSAFPAADQYLYMVVGAQTDADYSAGMIIVTLVGVDLS